MKNIKDLVLPLEKSKELVDKGVELDTVFWWYDTRKSWKNHHHYEGEFVPFTDTSGGVDGLVGAEAVLTEKKEGWLPPNHGYNESDPLPAPTMQELLEALPRDIGDCLMTMGTTFSDDVDDQFVARYDDNYAGLPESIHFGDSLLTALADLMLWVKANGLEGGK